MKDVVPDRGCHQEGHGTASGLPGDGRGADDGNTGLGEPLRNAFAVHDTMPGAGHTDLPEGLGNPEQAGDGEACAEG